VGKLAPVSVTGDIVPWIVCQIAPHRSSRLPLGLALGSHGRQPVLLLGHLGVALVEPGIFDELD
jgi:hypothetical protein